MSLETAPSNSQHKSLRHLPRYRKRLSRTMFWSSTRKDHCNVFRTRLLSFARDCFFVGRNGVRAGPARAICPTGANSQSQQFAGRPAAASGSGLAGGPAGIARRIRIQRIRNGRVLARHQRGSQSAAQCAAPFPSTPARSALKTPTIPPALNAAEHIRITLDHGFGDGLHVLVIATDGGDLVL